VTRADLCKVTRKGLYKVTPEDLCKVTREGQNLGEGAGAGDGDGAFAHAPVDRHLRARTTSRGGAGGCLPPSLSLSLALSLSHSLSRSRSRPLSPPPSLSRSLWRALAAPASCRALLEAFAWCRFDCLLSMVQCSGFWVQGLGVRV
jgi:hypothetical protein